MDLELSPAARNLTTPYEGVAIYFEDADSLDYVREDVPVVHRRVDEILTMIVDMRSREPIGFQIKGFRGRYLQDRALGAPELDFPSLVGFVERLMTKIGPHFVDQHRKAAYERAHKIALEDRVQIPELPRAAVRG